MRPRGLVIASMALHGLAYAFFIGVGFVYVDQVAPGDILGSALGLLTVVLFGFGFFLGTQFTGVVMDRFRADEKFRWRPIFLVPCALTLACAIAFAALFRG
jgi:MFS family permease